MIILQAWRTQSDHTCTIQNIGKTGRKRGENGVKTDILINARACARGSASGRHELSKKSAISWNIKINFPINHSTFWNIKINFLINQRLSEILKSTFQ
jgi:hypothetical protein